MRTELCDLLDIEFPIFAFSHCRDVVAAVSKAGGFGVLGALAFSAEQLELELQWIDENVGGRPYGVDTVIPAAYVGRDQGEFTREQLEALLPAQHKQFLNELLEQYEVPKLPPGIDAGQSVPGGGLLGWSLAGGRAHVDVALKHPIRLIANALGPPPADVIERAHAQNVLVAALVGRVDQALVQKQAGVDIIVASGYEAGGHTGEVTTMVLTPEVVDAVAPTPVLAAGGIGTGRQIAAALALGAQGVWTGSIWLTVSESDTAPLVQEKLLKAKSTDTIRSRSLSGKPARQLKTAYIDAWERKDTPDPLPMPLQFLLCADAMTRIGRAARQGGKAAELMGTPVGQIVGAMNQQQSARELIYEMVEGYFEATRRLDSLAPKE
jgi:NAD(P)H-dependent flavin oxidoreductase YrpB (nitropropane dioxygenase family)